jgi:ureidoacrylate peracid hydrolase
MHKIAIPQSVIDRVVARRGKALSFDGLDPRKTALVVVDMQNAFMLPGVAHSPCAEAIEIVPNINRLARALRAGGGAVAWIKTRFTQASLAEWSNYYDMLTPARVQKRIEALSPGGQGYEIWSALEQLPGDLTIDKNRFSAFLPGSSDTAERLRARGIDTVLITGTVTNVCCESTARDAMMLNFRTIMVTDGNAAVTDEEHNASLIAFYLNFGDVMSTDLLVTCIERNARLASAAQ